MRTAIQLTLNLILCPSLQGLLDQIKNFAGPNAQTEGIALNFILEVNLAATRLQKRKKNLLLISKESNTNFF